MASCSYIFVTLLVTGHMAHPNKDQHQSKVCSGKVSTTQVQRQFQFSSSITLLVKICAQYLLGTSQHAFLFSSLIVVGDMLLSHKVSAISSTLAFPTAIPLDNNSFKGDSFKFRHLLESDISGNGIEITL